MKPAISTGAPHLGNNFDAIRIVAASMVLVSHHFALTGQMEPTFFGVHTLGGMAVAVFFAISGYLVTASWQRDPHLLRFALRRFLRIWPALTATIVGTAYGLGVWLTSLPLTDYLTHGATVGYLQGLWMKIHFVLPGVFEHNPYRLGVNGSLWTIPFEVRCYIVLGIAGLCGLLRLRAVFLACIALYMTWFYANSNADVTGVVNYGRELSAFFLVGGALFALQDQWNRYPVRWAMCIGVACTVAWAVGWRHTAVLLGLPFAVVYLGTRSTAFVRHAGRWGDPSYGIYLFAFPIQQTVIQHLWPQAGFLGTMALALLITVACAYASWHLIEKQALKLKPRSRPAEPYAAHIIQAFVRLARQPSQWFWPLLACGAGLNFIAQRLDVPVLPDPAFTYLPAARAFLEHGWSFLLTPESYHVTPLAYLWPALWGADPASIRLANMGLWVCCVWFLWRTCCMLGGLRAGAMAMLLLLSPELVRYFPSEMTEPLYLFGILGGMHAMARIVIGQERSRAVIAQGALMLTITLLSRPVLQLVAPAAWLLCMGCLAYGLCTSKPGATPPYQRQVSTIAWSLGLAMLLPVALVVKNGVVFDLWGLGTGAGVGLYLGTHPLYQGAEPGFLGFGYDINTMVALAATASNPLSIAGDGAARQAALWQIHAMPLADALHFFVRKLWWWLAHHPSQISAFGSSLRKLRFFELLLVLTSLAWWVCHWWGRAKQTHSSWQQGGPSRQQGVFVVFLLLMFLAMLGQLLPILYNSRYSSALLDPWLIPLAAWGFAYITKPLVFDGQLGKRSWSVGVHAGDGSSAWPSIATLAGIVLLTFTGYNLTRHYEHIAVDPLHMGKMRTYVDVTDPARVHPYGMQAQGDRTWITTASPSVLLIQIQQDEVQRVTDADIFNALWKSDIALSGRKACRTTDIAYQTSGGLILQPTDTRPLHLVLQTDGAVHALVTHANKRLRPTEAGSLRIVLNCPVGTTVRWEGTQLLESRHAWDAAAHINPSVANP